MVRSAVKIDKLMKLVKEDIFYKCHIIAIDEAHFFTDLLEFVKYAEKHYKIIKELPLMRSTTMLNISIKFPHTRQLRTFSWKRLDTDRTFTLVKLQKKINLPFYRCGTSDYNPVSRKI